MDDPALDPKKHEHALNDLSFMNLMSNSTPLIAKEVFALARELNRAGDSETLTLLDIATGAGDIPIALAQAARKQGIKLDITVADISERALQFVTAKAQHQGVKLKTTKLDVLSDTPSSSFDVVTTSLFTHHLDPPEVTHLLATMGKTAKELVLVNDLVRSPINLALVYLATRLLASSEIVQYDGPVSVRAAYTTDEMRELATAAGLTGARVEGKFPCRMLLSWRVPREQKEH